MSDNEDKIEKLEQISETKTESEDDRTLYLRNGRSLVVGEEGNEEVLQIAAASGQIELRVRLTEEGPVLQFEGARLELKATEVVDIKCKVFKVEAEESVELLSKGVMNIESEGELSIKSVDDVRVVGKIIYLN
jgi:hypothetical protein